MFASKVAESYQPLIDVIIRLANANGLSSKSYESALSGFSAQDVTALFKKVSSLGYHWISHQLNLLVNGFSFCM